MRGSGSRALLVAATVFSSLLAPVGVGAHSSVVSLHADADGPAIATTNRNLIGVGWDRAGFTPDAMEPLRPNLVRIDASLERLYPSGPDIDATALDALVAEASEAIGIGGEPVVILSYTPVWLGDPDRPTSDRTKVPPSDAVVWGGLVTEVVERLVSAGVRFFEAWNEPDLLVFFQGLPNEFFDQIYRPSAEAVMDVERETGIDLWFGGCACFFADPAWIVPMMVFARTNRLPLDFISWHHYGNTPFLGPDGAEPLGPPEIRPLLAPLRQRNPVTSPSSYGDQIAAVRAWRDVVYGDASERPELWIDEWNLSAGGFDHRHDTGVGAAFQAATLVEFQRAGLDRASVFRAVDPSYGTDVVAAEPELYGGWGLVGRYGTVKPAWRAHHFWRDLGPDVLSYASPLDARLGVSGLVTRRDARRIVGMVASFQAAAEHAHDVLLQLTGASDRRWRVRVSALDGSSRTFDVSAEGDVLSVPLELPANSAVLIRMHARG